MEGYDLNNTGVLSWPELPPRSKGNVALIPFISGVVGKNHEDMESTRYNGKAGLDAKIGITTSLNLDLTLNPDFSNVDDVFRILVEGLQQETLLGFLGCGLGYFIDELQVAGHEIALQLRPAKVKYLSGLKARILGDDGGHDFLLTGCVG